MGCTNRRRAHGPGPGRWRMCRRHMVITAAVAAAHAHPCAEAQSSALEGERGRPVVNTVVLPEFRVASLGEHAACLDVVDVPIRKPSLADCGGRKEPQRHLFYQVQHRSAAGKSRSRSRTAITRGGGGGVPSGGGATTMRCATRGSTTTCAEQVCREPIFVLSMLDQRALASLRRGSRCENARG